MRRAEKRIREYIEEIVLPDLSKQIDGTISDLTKQAEECARKYQEAFFAFDKSREASSTGYWYQGRFQSVSVAVSTLGEKYEHLKKCAVIARDLFAMNMCKVDAYLIAVDSDKDFFSVLVRDAYKAISTCLMSYYSELTNDAAFEGYLNSGNFQLRHRLWKALEGFRQLSERTYRLVTDFNSLMLELDRMIPDNCRGL